MFGDLYARYSGQTKRVRGFNGKYEHVKNKDASFPKDCKLEKFPGTSAGKGSYDVS